MYKILTFLRVITIPPASAQLLIRIDKTDPLKTLTFQNTLADKLNVHY
jgi:hypothetical protein